MMRPRWLTRRCEAFACWRRHGHQGVAPRWAAGRSAPASVPPMPRLTAEDPRERALERAATAMQLEEARACAVWAGFPEVPASDPFQATWRVITSRRWKRCSRRILELDGSALV